MDELAFSSRLTTQEKLLLSQAVYKLGALQWPNISKLLLSHPCCRDRPAELFTPEGCEESYVGLMTAIGVNVPAEGATKPLASVHLRLAQTFYLARLSELQTQIASYETQFTSLMSEISAIRSGGLDEAIRNEVRAVLARKYGKRLLDSWVPPVEDIRGAVEAGPVSEEEVKKEEEGVRAGMGTAKKDGETDKEKEQVDEKMEKEKQAETVTTISEVTGEEQTEKVVDEGITEPAGEDVEMEQSPKQAGEEPEAPPAITAEPTVSLPSEEKEFAKAPTASPTKSSRSELSPAPGSPLSEAPDQVDENEVEAPQRGDKTEAPESSAKSPVAKESEPEAEVEEREPETESEAEPEPEPEPETTTTRSRKRKASVPPKAPPAKRSGRRVASPVDTAPDTEAASEPEPEAMEVEEEGEGEGEGVGEGNEEAEVEADQEVEVEAEAEAEEEEEAPTTRGRRASKRHAPAKVPTSKKASAAAAAPESPSARTKDSSPAISRRAPSVSSTTSATPATAEERRSSRLGRGRHSDAASVVAAVKHREQSAAVESVKEEDGEQEDGEEKKTTRTSARRKGAAEVEVSTPVPDKRSKRGSIRNGPRVIPRPRPFFLLSHNSYNYLNSLNQPNPLHPLNPEKSSAPADTPNYYDVIKRPMDLKTIRGRIRDGQVTTIDEFERDVLLMFANAMMYNTKGSQVYDMAEEMLRESENHIAHFRTLQHDVGR
ncbi:hypothetical protein JCM24511_06361 [Saitozyma sp. JCM 24511]|nr:hypothetical protein JCM24511_06361 [Saitozyma sp. JCM 24511]